MQARRGMLLCAVAAGLAAGCATQTGTTVPAGAEVYPAAPGPRTYVTTAPVTGTVVRVDEPERVLVFEDGSMWQVAGDSAVLIDGTPTAIGRIAPGTRVIVQSGRPVELRDGRYDVVTVAPAAGFRRTVWGIVTDVDRDGEITVKSPDGDEFEIRVPGDVARRLRTGDAVRLDMEFLPGGRPAASPRLP